LKNFFYLFFIIKEVIIINFFSKIYFSSISILIFFSVIIILCFYICFQNTNTNLDDINLSGEELTYYFSNTDFFWPLPGFHRITSPFGKRVSPTSGASTYHSGIDIAAPEGTNIYSVTTGKVIFIGFKGAGGFTITVESNNYNISYCHVSPNYIVSVRNRCK